MPYNKFAEYDRKNQIEFENMVGVKYRDFLDRLPRCEERDLTMDADGMVDKFIKVNTYKMKNSTPQILIFKNSFKRSNFANGQTRSGAYDRYLSVVEKENFYNNMKNTLGEEKAEEIRLLSRATFGHLKKYVTNINNSGQPFLMPNPAQIEDAYSKFSFAKSESEKKQCMNEIYELLTDSLIICWANNLETSIGLEPQEVTQKEKEK